MIMMKHLNNIKPWFSDFNLMIQQCQVKHKHMLQYTRVYIQKFQRTYTYIQRTYTKEQV